MQSIMDDIYSIVQEIDDSTNKIRDLAQSFSTTSRKEDITIKSIRNNVGVKMRRFNNSKNNNKK